MKEINNNGEGEKMREPKQKTEDQFAKIAISKEADRALVDLISRIEEDFESSRATKQEMASQAIIRFASDCAEKEITELRKWFFDPYLALEAKLKKAKETGSFPEDLRNLLMDQFSSASVQPGAKRTKKLPNDDYIKDIVQHDKEVA